MDGIAADWEKYVNPETLTRWGVSIGTTLLILFVGWIIAGWGQRAARNALTSAKVDLALAGFLASIVRYILLFAVIIAAAGQVGIETTSLTAIFASAGLAIGLALQGSLGNFASGVMILFFRPFTIGDVITTSGVTGGVEAIGLFATDLRLPDGTKVIVPNGGVTGGEIRNHTQLGKRRATIQVGVDYGSDLDKVKEVLLAAAQSVPEVLSEEGRMPAAVFTTFGGSSLDFDLNCWFLVPDWWPGQEKVKLAVYKALAEAGIGIPFPQMDVHVDGALSGTKTG